MATSGARLPSVIIFRLRNMHPTRVNQHLLQVLQSYEAQLRKGVVMSISEGQLRLRTLPIDTAGSSQTQ